MMVLAIIGPMFICLWLSIQRHSHCQTLLTYDLDFFFFYNFIVFGYTTLIFRWDGRSKVKVKHENIRKDIRDQDQKSSSKLKVIAQSYFGINLCVCIDDLKV